MIGVELEGFICFVLFIYLDGFGIGIGIGF